MRLWETVIQAETDDSPAVAVALTMTTKTGTRGQKHSTATPCLISGKDRTTYLMLIGPCIIVIVEE